MTPAELKDWASVIIGIIVLAASAVITIYARLGAVRSKQQLIESRAANIGLAHARRTIDELFGEVLTLNAQRRRGAHADGSLDELGVPQPAEPEPAPEPAPQPRAVPAQPPAEPPLDTTAIWARLGQ